MRHFKSLFLIYGEDYHKNKQTKNNKNEKKKKMLLILIFFVKNAWKNSLYETKDKGL